MKTCFLKKTQTTPEAFYKQFFHLKGQQMKAKVCYWPVPLAQVLFKDNTFDLY